MKLINIGFGSLLSAGRILAIVDPDTNTLAEPLEFMTRGFIQDPQIFDTAAKKVKDALAKPHVAQIDDLDQIEKLIIDTVARHLDRAYRRAPLISAVVVDA